MHDHEIAAILDPERQRKGWWGTYIGGMFFKLNQRESKEELGLGTSLEFCGPAFHTDDAACFRWIRPVLLAMGCVLNEVCNCAVVYVYDSFGKKIIANESTYSTALCDAITYAHEHRRDELVRAVEEVKHGALG